MDAWTPHARGSREVPSTWPGQGVQRGFLSRRWLTLAAGASGPEGPPVTSEVGWGSGCGGWNAVQGEERPGCQASLLKMGLQPAAEGAMRRLLVACHSASDTARRRMCRESAGVDMHASSGGAVA